MNSRACILILNHDPAHPHFSSWLPACPHPVKAFPKVPSDFAFPEDTGILITVDTAHHPNPTLARRAVELNVPTLVLADGSLGYRNTFERPEVIPGSCYQPVLAHKIACIGRSQARYLESWGNAGKCEVIGVPRFDRYANLQRRTRKPEDPFRILISTTTTPYSTAEQHACLTDSLAALKRFFDTTPPSGSVQLEPVWRLTAGLDQEIGVPSHVADVKGIQLAEALQTVDALITTPSTVLLEGMLLGIPVATLDFKSDPAYVQPAWCISAETHIPRVIEELINPPAPKLLFQHTSLHDALECATAAQPRMVKLVDEMISIGLQARSANRPLTFPGRIIEPVVPITTALGENQFRHSSIFPEHPIFKEDRLAVLQVELAHLRDQVSWWERRKPSKTPAAHKRDAAACLQRNDAATALEEFKGAVAQCPDDADAIAAIGGILLNSERYGEALPWLQRARSLQPTNGTVHLQIAMALLWQDRMQDALNAVQAALDFDPSSHDAEQLRDAIKGYIARNAPSDATPSAQSPASRGLSAPSSDPLAQGAIS